MKDNKEKKEKTCSEKLKRSGGFTLIEIMVSISIFAIVLTIVGGSIVAVFDSNRKSQSLRAVMDNLNLTLESMTRTIRFGYTYHCDVNTGSISSPRNCSSGASSMAVTTSPGSQTSFRLTGGRVERSINGGSYSAITGSDVTITNLTFYVFGAGTYLSSSDTLQPRAVIVVSGYAGIKPSSQSSFTVQTTISQRRFDSQ